jgi:hypothetical protein
VNQSFQRTLQRTPDLLQESEETIGKTLSRFRGLREYFCKLSSPVWTPKSPSGFVQLAAVLSGNTSASVQETSRLRRATWLPFFSRLNSR